MKSYLSNLQEILPENLLEGLLGYGLFAEKIPNFLSSEKFYKFYLSENKPIFEQKEKDYIRYDSMRNTNVPRPLSIPNPFSYANLCNYLSQNWQNIVYHFQDTLEHETFKVSRIHLRKLKDKKYLFEMNYKNHEKDGVPEHDLIIGKRYSVEADISSCFPSIYSHSIPWALVGKTESKQNKDDKSKWYNILDFNLRNIKNGETNGILIGPHVSNLISEIILVVVDKELWSKGYRYVRNIDDYKCFTKTFEEAEKFILDLNSELKKFELNLNNKKTKISPLPKASIVNWVNKLNNFPIEERYTEKGDKIFGLKQLKAFMDLAIELMLEENDTAVLNYAMKVVSNKHLGKAALDYYIKQIHHLVLLYPYLILLLEEHLFLPFEITKEKIKEIAKDVYTLGTEKRVYEASSYGVYFALKYGFDLEEINLKEDAFNSHDCIFLLLGFLVAKKNKDKVLLKEYKEKAISLKLNDFNRYWVFIYECLTPSYFEGDFKRIKNKKVTFLKPIFNK